MDGALIAGELKGGNKALLDALVPAGSEEVVGFVLPTSGLLKLLLG